jgi:hypothetical protein
MKRTFVELACDRPGCTNVITIEKDSEFSISKWRTPWGDLCPECHEEYNKLRVSFWGAKKPKPPAVTCMHCVNFDDSCSGIDGRGPLFCRAGHGDYVGCGADASACDDYIQKKGADENGG